jgi:hypothetical protein
MLENKHRVLETDHPITSPRRRVIRHHSLIPTHTIRSLHDLKSQRHNAQNNRAASNKQHRPDRPPLRHVAHVMPQHPPVMRVLAFGEALEVQDALAQEGEVGRGVCFRSDIVVGGADGVVDRTGGGGAPVLAAEEEEEGVWGLLVVVTVVTQVAF